MTPVLAVVRMAVISATMASQTPLRFTSRRAGTWWPKPCRRSICLIADTVIPR